MAANKDYTVDEMKEIIGEIWKEILEEDEDIEEDTSFFELGGNSLLGSVMMEELIARTGCTFDIAEIYEKNTISLLAEYLVAGNKEVADTLYEQDKDGNEEFELTKQQEFMLKDDEKNKGFIDRCAGTFNVPVPLRLYGKIDIARFEESLQKTIVFFDALRLEYVERYGKYSQKVRKEIPVKLEITKIEGESDEEKAASAMEMARKFVNSAINEGTNIGKQLWKYVMYEINEEDYIFVFLMHHSMSDGTSQQIFGKVLMNFYAGEDNGEPYLYRDFIQYDKDFIASERGMEQVKYWTNELEGYKPVDWNIFAPKGEEEQKHITMKTDMELFNKISEKTGASRLMIYMAAYHAALSKVLEEPDVMVGLSCANRTRIKFMKTLGYFSRGVQNRVIITDDMKYTDLLELMKNKINKNLEAQQTAHLFEQGQFMISYGAYKVVTDKIPLGDTGIECEILQVNPERAFAFFIICAYEFPDYVLSDFHGNPNVYSIAFQEGLAKYIQEAINIMSENPNALVNKH